MDYCLDGQGNVTVAGNVTLTNLSNGAHNLTVYVKDTEGSFGTSENIVFTVAKPEPFPTVPVVASVIAVIMVVAGLLVYFKRRKHEAKLT